jgi:hypothetical protein
MAVSGGRAAAHLDNGIEYSGAAMRAGCRWTFVGGRAWFGHEKQVDVDEGLPPPLRRQIHRC